MLAACSRRGNSALLGLGGGGLGILVAFWGTRLFIALAPDDFPRIDAVTVDLRVLAFAFGISVVTALAIGLVALFRVLYDRAYDGLREEGRSATADRRGGSVRGVLVVVELAFALVLLVGAGLLVRSFARLMAVDETVWRRCGATSGSGDSLTVQPVPILAMASWVA